jgi:hypothetical protein
MPKVLKSSDLRGLTAAEKSKVFRALLNSAKPVNSIQRIKILRSQIFKYEQKYKMSTSKMLSQLCSGKLQETKEIEKWSLKHMALCAHEQNISQQKKVTA